MKTYKYLLSSCLCSALLATGVVTAKVPDQVNTAVTNGATNSVIKLDLKATKIDGPEPTEPCPTFPHC